MLAAFRGSVPSAAAAGLGRVSATSRTLRFPSTALAPPLSQIIGPGYSRTSFNESSARIRCVLPDASELNILSPSRLLHRHYHHLHSHTHRNHLHYNHMQMSHHHRHHRRADCTKPRRYHLLAGSGFDKGKLATLFQTISGTAVWWWKPITPAPSVYALGAVAADGTSPSSAVLSHASLSLIWKPWKSKLRSFLRRRWRWRLPGILTAWMGNGHQKPLKDSSGSGQDDESDGRGLMPFSSRNRNNKSTSSSPSVDGHVSRAGGARHDGPAQHDGAKGLFDFFNMVLSARRPRPTYRLKSEAAGIPYPGKGSKSSDSGYLSTSCGEDAYFVLPDSIGVADGVGGWASTPGADPALYSRLLMHHAAEYLQRLDFSLSGDDESYVAAADVPSARFPIVSSSVTDSEDWLGSSSVSQLDYIKDADPVNVLRQAQMQVKGVIGSSTACIAILRHDELLVGNLGDCGIVIVRDGSFLFRTEEQQHSFNFPYQLGTGSEDSAEDSHVYTVKILPGDLIIMGSDGLFDNVFEEDLLQIIRDRHLSGFPVGLAKELVMHAKDIAEDHRQSSTPFSSRALAEGLYYQGGKLDDITVIVARVEELEDSPDRR